LSQSALTEITIVRHSHARILKKRSPKPYTARHLEASAAAPAGRISRRDGGPPKGKIFFDAPSFVLVSRQSPILGKSEGRALIFRDETPMR
jgi:hypothetical protein